MNLDKVLDDLNAERQWLDTVIGALEVTSRLPAYRLVRILDQSLLERRSPGQGLHFGPRRKGELVKLAQLVRPCKGPTGPRSSSNTE